MRRLSLEMISLSRYSRWNLTNRTNFNGKHGKATKTINKELWLVVELFPVPTNGCIRGARQKSSAHLLIKYKNVVLLYRLYLQLLQIHESLQLTSFNTITQPPKKYTVPQPAHQSNTAKLIEHLTDFQQALHYNDFLTLLHLKIRYALPIWIWGQWGWVLLMMEQVWHYRICVHPADKPGEWAGDSDGWSSESWGKREGKQDLKRKKFLVGAAIRKPKPVQRMGMVPSKWGECGWREGCGVRGEVGCFIVDYVFSCIVIIIVNKYFYLVKTNYIKNIIFFLRIYFCRYKYTVK